jgi:hypothetical protein
MFIKAVTPDCPICGISTDVMVDFEMYKAWCNKEILVQDAFPAMSKEEREVLMTGTHPDCWNIMWAGIDEEEELGALDE